MITLILAGTFQHAHVAADLLNYRPSEWKYVSRYRDLCGVGEGRHIVVYETAGDSRNYADLAERVAYLVEHHGATVEYLSGDARPLHPGARK